MVRGSAHSVFGLWLFDYAAAKSIRMLSKLVPFASLRRRLLARAYLDLGFRERDIIFVAGTARSGTTWVGEVIAQATRGRIIFEPFLLDTDWDFTPTKQSYLDESQLLRNVRLYIPNEACARSSYHDQIEQILKGRVWSRWSEVQARPGLFRRRVIKEIRANLFLGYIVRHWSAMKIILVIRHPWHVINSQLAKNGKGWGFDWDEEIYTQKQLGQDWLQPFSGLIREANGIIDRLALQWCIETYVPLKQLQHAQNRLVVRYEELAYHPSERWPVVAEFLSDTGWSEQLFRKRAPALTFTSARTLDQIRKRHDPLVYLTPKAKARIAHIVEAFGLDEFLVPVS